MNIYRTFSIIAVLGLALSQSASASGVCCGIEHEYRASKQHVAYAATQNASQSRFKEYSDESLIIHQISNLPATAAGEQKQKKHRMYHGGFPF